VGGDLTERIAAELGNVVKGDVFSDILHRAAFSSDASIYRIIPQCVVVPRDVSDIAAVVNYARRNGIAVAARGAGSGLAGESLCSGIVFDMTRYMNRIISFDESSGAAVCEPGVVLDELNDYLSRYGRKIGPDPSSSNRATVGGCVANNATGAHSLEYGYMANYVEGIEAVLADGSIVEFINDFNPKQGGDKIIVSLAERCLAVLGDKQEIINKALPKTKRNRSGYNIAGICHDTKVDLARLMAGSEGTLAIFTKIKLRTVEMPAVKVLLQLEFDSLDKMSRVVPAIAESGAAACELMDKRLMAMAREALPEYRDVLPAGIEASILVEHVGKTQEEVLEKIKVTDNAVGGAACGRKIILDAAEQKRLWKSRKDAVPLLFRKKGKKKPVAFMEDVSVENGRLAEYITGLEEIGRRYDVEMSFYGHAGDGELHVRPYLDLSDKAEVEKMRAMADEVFSLAWSLGGSISGEHADGLVRAAFIRGQYGDEFYEILRDIKKIFDPAGLMNPGKIINSDVDIMTKNLRAEQGYLPQRLETELIFGEGELALELDQCNGCGVCLSREAELRMCPVFRALGEELGSSRAKANILSLWAKGQIDEKKLESDEFKEFLDLCVNCKACSLQCPSGVDISKLMMAARAEYVKRKGLKRTESALSNNRYLSKLGSMFSGVANFAGGFAFFNWLIEKTTGLDRRRGLPKFGRGTFLKAGRAYLANCGKIAAPTDRVAYFADTYVNFNDHELGLAVLEVLRHNNIEVILPRQRPAPMPSMVYGDYKRARKDLEYNVTHLAKAVRDGYKIICSEPSAALCLQQELRHFVAGEEAELVSKNSFELMSYLLGLYKENKLKVVEKQQAPPGQAWGLNDKGYVYHCPCHLFALGMGAVSIELLDKVCGIKVSEIKAGCCGIAGTFGMQKKNSELSEKIAERLKNALEKLPGKIVLTECAACKMQIEHISGNVVQHPIKVIAMAYGGHLAHIERKSVVER
jgi:FAD/FMN-containing dehydrogenase/Fe-S oxidoreductase